MQQTGIVKWFSRPKGFGFVVSEAGEDVFVPHDALRAAGITELKVGERLFFEAGIGEKGLTVKRIVDRLMPSG